MHWIGNNGADRIEAGFLAHLAPGDLFGRFVGVDEPRNRLDLPRRAPGVERGHPELLNEDDAVLLGVVQHNRDRRAAPHHVEHPLAAPAAGKQAVAKAYDLDPQMTGKAGLGTEDLDIRVLWGRRGRARFCGHDHSRRVR